MNHQTENREAAVSCKRLFGPIFKSIQVCSPDENSIFRKILWRHNKGCLVQGDFRSIACAKVTVSGFELDS
jgi:hypothetical protein